MGASNSRADKDKGLQLCRARKKFIKQALNGRCSLASSHIAYIYHLQTTGTSLSKFIVPDAQVEPFPHSPITISTGKHSQVASRLQSNAMEFHSTASTEVYEKLPAVATVTSTGAPAWDYFELFRYPDDHFSSQEWMEFNSKDKTICVEEEEEEGMPELEDVDGIEEAEDEFDEPPPASLVRSFRNINAAFGNVPSEAEFKSSNDADKTGQDVARGESPLKDHISPRSVHLNEEATEECAVLEDDDTARPKDLFSSIGDIERFFVEASESGKEVPRMLEANKFHFRPVKERGLKASPFLKSCFSCRKDPSKVQQEAPQSTVKYLTWHRTGSSRSASEQNPLLMKLTDHINDQDNDQDNNLFNNSCMVSGSHALTLDRLYAWEKKLYDEVKAGQVLRDIFDRKCKILQQKESRGESADKLCAMVKDLHSRIRVAIHRINSISKKIEEIRDSELQPQLEELIEGLRRMWETMARCHKHQFLIVSTSHIPGGMTIKAQPEATLNFKNELDSLSSTLTKSISGQKTYVEAIDKWLFKCVSIPQNPTKRNRRMKPPTVRNYGPPIYTMCGTWLEMIDQLPVRDVIESITTLVAEVARFGPNQDKSQSHEEPMPNNLDRVWTGLAALLEQLDKFAQSCVEMFGELQKGIREAKWNYDRSEARTPSQAFE